MAMGRCGPAQPDRQSSHRSGVDVGREVSRAEPGGGQGCTGGGGGVGGDTRFSRRWCCGGDGFRCGWRGCIRDRGRNGRHGSRRVFERGDGCGSGQHRRFGRCGRFNRCPATGAQQHCRQDQEQEGQGCRSFGQGCVPRAGPGAGSGTAVFLARDHRPGLPRMQEPVVCFHLRGSRGGRIHKMPAFGTAGILCKDWRAARRRLEDFRPGSRRPGRLAA